jgi:BirA family transcriptional regulator, biotin operon repressor / biotin---[acetyl-CoA-carboxylase] ligase
MAGPPETSVRALVECGLLSGLEWHERTGSTNTLAAEAAARGVGEVYAVLADYQTAGRGRLGRSWQAPSGTSLLCSLIIRPLVPTSVLGLLPLLIGLALAEAVDALIPGLEVALKWPNDLLIDGRKGAGVLVESGPADAVIVGIGVNVDWRDVDRPPKFAAATSLAEAAGRPVDRWEMFAALARSFAARYHTWPLQPTGFLDAYRQRCVTLGSSVRVSFASGEVVSGRAIDITCAGTLVLRLPHGATTEITAGDVEHVRSSMRRAPPNPRLLRPNTQ